jgi:quinol monooxygenase YgiN
MSGYPTYRELMASYLADAVILPPANLYRLMGFITTEKAIGEPTEQRMVRIAELEINADQLTAYTAALKEEINISVRVEPGVITLCAVAVRDHPTQIRIFETYADRAAYESHLQTPHFKKYKTETAKMVSH